VEGIVCQRCRLAIIASLDDLLPYRTAADVVNAHGVGDSCGVSVVGIDVRRRHAVISVAAAAGCERRQNLPSSDTEYCLSCCARVASPPVPLQVRLAARRDSPALFATSTHARHRPPVRAISPPRTVRPLCQPAATTMPPLPVLTPEERLRLTLRMVQASLAEPSFRNTNRLMATMYARSRGFPDSHLLVARGYLVERGFCAAHPTSEDGSVMRGTFCVNGWTLSRIEQALKSELASLAANGGGGGGGDVVSAGENPGTACGLPSP